MPRNLIPFPGTGPDADAHAQAETERKQQLFNWADELLKQLGLDAIVAQAQTDEELHKIGLNLDAIEIRLAIREALHPAAGQRAKHFIALKEGALKRLLQARLDELKHDRRAKLDGGTGTAGTDAAGARSSSPSWTNGLKLDKDGGVLPILTNLILYLRKHPGWQDVLAFDEFYRRVVFRKPPPDGDEWGEQWGAQQGNEPLNVQLADHHETHIRTWFEGEDIIANQTNIGRAIQAAARFNRFHPVRDYLKSLPLRDGKVRLETWLTDYLGVKDSPYVRAIGPRVLISAVARIFKPGCKVDNMLVLEGPQDLGKSLALQKLFEPWCTGELAALGSKDAKIEMGGVWMIEVAEMEAINKATVGTTKSFLTQQSDRYVPKWGKHPIDQPRQCILAGTINPLDDEGYLKDPTGSRRIWPVLCGVINIAALERDRDQLWAEAVARFEAGELWWLDTSELKELAKVEQAKRFKTDTYEEPIKEYLDYPDHVHKGKVTTIDELLLVLGMDPKKKKENHSAVVRIVKIPILAQAGLQEAPGGGQGQARCAQGQARAQIRILAAVIFCPKGWDHWDLRGKTMSSSVLHMPGGSPALPRARLIYAVDATGSRNLAGTSPAIYKPRCSSRPGQAGGST